MCAGVPATSSARRITPPPPLRSGPRERSPIPKACPSSPGRAKRWRNIGGVPSAPWISATAQGRNQIVDDGGDATLLIHKGVEFENAGKVPSPDTTDNEEFKEILKLLAKCLKQDSPALAQGGRRNAGRLRRNHHRRASAVRNAKGRHAALPRHQRQRQRHQEQVRQSLRLPPFAGRRPDAGDRCHAQRQSRRRLRLRRCRQGMLPIAQGPGRARDRHRDRSDLRPAGGDGRVSRF